MTEQPPDTPTFLKVVGDLALTSLDDPNSSLDVALIKLHDQNVYTVNEIPLGSEPGAPCLYSEKIAKIELEDAEIVTVTASGGLLRGRLSATPTYMRLPHRKNFQKVYTVRLDGTIADGDCGSLVIHSANGDLYGHIIAGSSGTGTAYIIPATHVFEDLEHRLGGTDTLDFAEVPGHDILSEDGLAWTTASTVLRPLLYTAHQQLQPLHPLIAMAPWPSMLTSPPVVPTAPLVTPVSASIASTTVTQVTATGGPAPRRTLTDDDRRRMCEYHESHPGVKQTEIGAMFGVERSTVSKVLRQKEKFLYSNDSSQNPAKKAKGKFPDIERALANWAKNEQIKGEPLNDSKIKEQAQRFAVTVGNSESRSKLTNSAWLKKFKQKNNLLGARPDSSTTSFSETPNSYSPVSPDSGEMVSPPTSPNQNSDGFGKYRSDDTEHFPAPSQDCGHEYSQKSPNSTYVGLSIAPVSDSIMSPTSPAPHRTNCRSDSPVPALHLHLPSRGSNFSRPRSQTFPNFTIEPDALIKSENQDETTLGSTDRSAATPVSDSAIEESPTAVDPRQMMKRNKSVPDIHPVRATSMQPPPVPPLHRSENTSPVSSVGSPTQDDARRALDLVWRFFQNQPAGILEPDEYATIGKMMVKLKLSHSPDGTPVLPGGMYPIDRSLSPRVSKKRTIDGIYSHDRVAV